jgi:hypothetical protein
MGGASDESSSGTEKVGCVRMGEKDRIGSPIDLASIWMRENEAEETVKASLFSGESAGGGKDASVHAALVVEQIAYLLWLGKKGQVQWGTGGGGESREDEGWGGVCLEGEEAGRTLLRRRWGMSVEI